MITELTIEEAISKGYIHCGKIKNEWQQLIPIEDLQDIDLDGDDLHLADPKPLVFTFDKESIAELLAETISNCEAEDTGRDDDEIYNAIKAMDFTSTENQISEVLKNFPSYKLTDIKLVKQK